MNRPNSQLRSRTYEFGPFHADPQNFLLLRNGESLSLQPKVFDTLVVLLEHAGTIISKDVLMSRLWPDTFVEESNLTQAISVLRKILSEGAGGHSWIETIPKRGYRFSAEVKTIVESDVEPPGERADMRLKLVSAEGPLTGGRTADAPEEQSHTPQSNKRTWQLQALIPVMAVIAVALTTLLIYARKDEKQQLASTTGREEILAVLPFTSIVSSERDDALGMGMTETIINKLNVIVGLTTLSLNTVRRYTNPDREGAAIGRDLGADWVLVGGIQSDDDNVRVTWRLWRVSDDSISLSDLRDEPHNSIFEVQDAIARRVARALKFHLSADGTRLLQRQETASVEAYQLYCEGLSLLESRTRKGGKQALDHFTSATLIDPTYARAYVGIARIQYEWRILPPPEALQAAESALLTALKHEPEFPEARSLLAYIRFERDSNKEAAEQEFRRALMEDDKSWDARYYYARFLGEAKQHEDAIYQARMNSQRAPRSPFYLTALAIQLRNGGKFQESIVIFEEALRLDPDRVGTLANLGRAYLEMKNYNEAIKTLARALISDPDPAAPRFALLAETYAKVGNKDQARKMLRELKAVQKKGEEWIPPESIERIHKALAE